MPSPTFKQLGLITYAFLELLEDHPQAKLQADDSGAVWRALSKPEQDQITDSFQTLIFRGPAENIRETLDWLTFIETWVGYAERVTPAGELAKALPLTIDDPDTLEALGQGASAPVTLGATDVQILKDAGLPKIATILDRAVHLAAAPPARPNAPQDKIDPKHNI